MSPEAALNIISGFVLGACLGSFCGAALYRLPRRESLMHPPSRCTGCGQALKPHDMVPIVSWLGYRGRARCCGQKLSAHYVGLEFLMAIAGALLGLTLGLGWHFALALAALTAIVAGCGLLGSRT